MSSLKSKPKRKSPLLFWLIVGALCWAVARPPETSTVTYFMPCEDGITVVSADHYHNPCPPPT